MHKHILHLCNELSWKKLTEIPVFLVFTEAVVFNYFVYIKYGHNYIAWADG